MSLDSRISFIGGGNMATALISGLLSAGTSRPDQLCASDVRDDALASLRQQYGIETTRDNARACQADVIVLSVKPQIFPTLLPELAPHIDSSKLVISIAAGVPLAAIEARLGGQVRAVRAMPNTPALVGAGATALSAGTRASARDLEVASQIFASVGVSVNVAEDLMDAVTALSGSGPAYVYLLAQGMIEAGVRIGLSQEQAETLARQTVYGAGKLLQSSPESAEELRRRVTSPGGTTHAGITTMESRGLRDALHAGIEAARDRGRELGREASEKLRGS
ncbi:MAG TPA: pyrroline-5-carboxylate reductase [Polyangiales bacterium]|jgi:pyrroline-5-carboxylate reductase|nr:pyrroline-5-carboxylate reductase [Polyangiales bacterium]